MGTMRAWSVAAGVYFTLSIGLWVACQPNSAPATDTMVTPGEFIVDPPTLINLGFEWVIDGDANRNALVEVSYRKQGDAAWAQGMPLLRLQGETIFQQNSWHLVSPNMFAGSILDLEPVRAAALMQRASVRSRPGRRGLEFIDDHPADAVTSR